ncbi:MAG: hypothetical protein JXR48_09135 [Candidatus Delongbacteria bacterium]|nr:hypothetical protein [Candidatus Delongbacteria bacterium]MBN2835115.1 hypothetical protein [Candidatus Delongbacteria bacterium]
MNLRTFKDLLNEQAIAKPGSWKPHVDFSAIKSANLVRLKYEYKGTIKSKSGMSLDVWLLKNNLFFITGFFDVEEIPTKSGIEEQEYFYIVNALQFNRAKTYERLFDVKKLLTAEGVITREEYQGDDISRNLYKFVVNTLNYTILSDSVQYFGARRLWSILSNEIDTIVDVVDYKEKKVLKTNVEIHHGKLDHEFDNEYYSREESKVNIRFILKKIK